MKENATYVNEDFNAVLLERQVDVKNETNNNRAGAEFPERVAQEKGTAQKSQKDILNLKLLRPGIFGPFDL